MPNESQDSIKNKLNIWRSYVTWYNTNTRAPAFGCNDPWLPTGRNVSATPNTLHVALVTAPESSVWSASWTVSGTKIYMSASSLLFGWSVATLLAPSQPLSPRLPRCLASTDTTHTTTSLHTLFSARENVPYLFIFYSLYSLIDAHIRVGVWSFSKAGMKNKQKRKDE